MASKSEKLGENVARKNLEKRKIGQQKKVDDFSTSLGSLGSFFEKDEKKKQEEYPIQKIEVSKIKERKEGNEFKETGIDSLVESIKAVGLIDPIQVVVENQGQILDETYYVIAGHRRLKAYKTLKNESDNYKKIPAIVYIITDDNEKIGIKGNFIYITKEIEERIYLDSNLESRQLSYGEVAKYIEKIVDRIEQEQEYKEKIAKDRSENGKYDTKEINLSEEIVKILSNYNYSGWSARTIRNFLDIRKLALYDNETKKLVLEITSKDGENLSVNSAYKTCSEKIKFLKILEAPQDSKRKFTKQEQEFRNEWENYTEGIKKDNFQKLFVNWNNKLNVKESNSKSELKFKSIVYAKKTLDYFNKEKNNISEEELEEIRKTINKLTKLIN